MDQWREEGGFVSFVSTYIVLFFLYFSTSNREAPLFCIRLLINGCGVHLPLQIYGGANVLTKLTKPPSRSVQLHTASTTAHSENDYG